ncbi:MAG: T9SS type A sorting domain-containing protein [Bacteroidales bacterium]|nr:T9SS type A sorting domain-containing protein [Bacteroidales bacterium]
MTANAPTLNMQFSYAQVISPDIANPSLMNFTWEDPFIEEGSPYSVVAYRIGRFNENTGEFVAIDQLSANVHLGKYSMDLFDGDYGIVAAVFNDAKRDNEELAFSNRSENEIVGVGEQNNETFGIYPNPAKGRFTIEGTGTMTVTNSLGQTILTREIDVKETMELPQGMYFVKLGEATRKVLVE